MRVLVTGASGFVGRRIVRLLGAAQHDVYGVSRSPSPAAHTIEMDFSKGLDARALPKHVDAIVHLAQSEHYREFPDRADHIYAVNVESTARLLQYSMLAGASRFVLASSGGIYGYSEHPLAETAAPRPPDFYLRTKFASEVLLFGYDQFISTVALRPFFIYGEGQRPTMFIPRLVRNVLHGRAITLSPPDGLLVNPIHVDDAARAFVAALTSDFTGPVNVAGPEVLSLGEIVRTIGRHLEREPVVEQVKDAPGNVIGDLALMSRVLGPPEVTFAGGVQEVCREAAAELAIEGR